MCGIIGIISSSNVANDLVEGLKRLEYRGYDSAGIATLHEGKIERSRAEGKIKNLEKLLAQAPLEGAIGIGHTRWATHGAPNTNNAHPHATDDVAVVHNGIIENFLELRGSLEKKGHKFVTETDTEVVPHLISDFLKSGLKPLQALQKAIMELRGAYALAILFKNDPHTLYAARHGSPLAIGLAEGAGYLGSDAIALAPFSNKIIYLEEGDIATISLDKTAILNKEGELVTRKIVVSSASSFSLGKENYRHFMQKEIFEQPSVLSDVFKAYVHPLSSSIEFPSVKLDFKTISRVTIVACGTSFYAGMIGKYWLEQVAGIAVDTDIASEFRYRGAVLDKNSLALFISQSGETADTLAALRECKARGIHTAALVNVPESTMAREADSVFYNYAGPEIGVASTKAFTSQVMALSLLAVYAAEQRRKLNHAALQQSLHTLSEVPSRISEVLLHDDAIKEIAQEISLARDVLYIGRGTAYPIALEGALKLKEISYIHAEAAAAGELKHGPIALVDENVPVIAIAPSGMLFEKTASNIREVAARGGKIILMSDSDGSEALADVAHRTIILPKSNLFAEPLLYAVPVQLLAYHTAVLKGTDVDQPRNLAKSVTVE